ncbi:ANTAR domain-containing response regulator [Streptomyces winkii]|uniref:ANTAR domain-containing response regulator n=1 Tax=Streptomyces winkii TaxID=3051178 RepID=UPI0028D7F834|nr:ANTAR domain-containing protein [Streptomyces sp. DSM 40971]
MSADEQRELGQLRRAMETRPVIDQAHGVLMATHGCTAQEAWQVLQSASQHTNTKLHVVAEQVVAFTQNEPPAEPIRLAIQAALRDIGKR